MLVPGPGAEMPAMARGSSLGGRSCDYWKQVQAGVQPQARSPGCLRKPTTSPCSGRSFPKSGRFGCCLPLPPARSCVLLGRRLLAVGQGRWFSSGLASCILWLGSRNGGLVVPMGKRLPGSRPGQASQTLVGGPLRQTSEGRRRGRLRLVAATAATGTARQPLQPSRVAQAL